MEATLRLPRRASYADYLAAEQDSDHHHEFIDGVIVAMAGGSDEHNAILAPLIRRPDTGGRPKSQTIDLLELLSPSGSEAPPPPA